jgi:hypothetical protein
MFHKKRRWTDYDGKANLETRCIHAEAKIELLSKEKTALDKRLNACHKELEQFYLKAIGDCRTVKQVQAVVKQYHESELGKDVWLTMKGSIGVCTSFHPQFESQTKVGRAASTKIKRINTRDARQICTMLDTTTDRTLYASSMATTLKGIANIEVDMTKVLAAKDSGLDAWSVLLSMLSAYGINHDNVLEVK